MMSGGTLQIKDLLGYICYILQSSTNYTIEYIYKWKIDLTMNYYIAIQISFFRFGLIQLYKQALIHMKNTLLVTSKVQNCSRR